MYDIDHTIPLVDLQLIRAPHFHIPIDEQSPFYQEPLVNLKHYDLPFLSWHAISDGNNPPYKKPIQCSSQEGWLRKTIAEKLARANQLLAPYNAELLILDAYRPIECQRGLWTFFYERGRRELPHGDEAMWRQ